VGGAMAISELMPAQYKHTLAGPSLKVDPHTGALAEGVLTFVITLAVLWVIVKGPRNAILKTLLLSVSIVFLILAGAEYTGPSMNPANVSILPFLSFWSLCVCLLHSMSIYFLLLILLPRTLHYGIGAGHEKTKLNALHV
jgi:glycerol uptake facilitator-like aquaporin